MSLEEIKSLDAEEAELQAQILKLREKKRLLNQQEAERKAQEERNALLKKEIVIKVIRNSGGLLITEADFRPDLVEVFQSIEGRVYQGSRHNGIPIGQWKTLEEKLSDLPFLSIEWAPNVKERYSWMLDAPPVEIDFNTAKQVFILTPGPSTSLSANIPGSAWEEDKVLGVYNLLVPRTEGWRIPPALTHIDGVVYSSIASALILGQVENRGKLDQIAIQDDTDFITEVNGFPLRPFQKVGVEFIYEAGGNVILADETGLGKTWQFLAYTELKRKENPDYRVLIIVKAAGIANWRREIKKLTGAEPFQCFTGSPNSYDAMKILVEKVPYVLISYDTLGSYMVLRDGVEIPKKEKQDGDEISYPWAKLFDIAKFSVRGYDEGHYIRNTTAFKTKAVFAMERTPENIPLTASPVLNKTEELGVLLRLVAPHNFNSHEDFKRRYTVEGLGKHPTNVTELHNMMRPMFIRREKKEVQKDLPPINRIYRTYELSSRGQRLYDKVMAGLYEELAMFDPRGIGGSEFAVTHILSQFTRLKQIAAADKVEHTVELAQDLLDQGDMFDEGERQKKVLIFSYFKGSAHEIARRLGPSAVCTVTKSNGKINSLNADQRDYIFEAARNNPNVKYVVTTEAAREIHNLEYCDWVIFNDPFWTAEAHYQAEGRAYGRLSDPHPIDSYYLMADTEIETIMAAIIAEKLAIKEKVIDGVEEHRDFMGSISTELIKRLKENLWTRTEK